jgi:hypothetical protein
MDYVIAFVTAAVGWILYAHHWAAPGKHNSAERHDGSGHGAVG